MGLLLSFVFFLGTSFCKADPCDPDELQRTNEKIGRLFISSCVVTASSCIALKASSSNNKKS